MAKTTRTYKVSVTKYDFPSRFGSHSSMINENAPAVKPGFVVLTDEYGDYVTEVSNLDNGLADKNRYQGFHGSKNSTSISKGDFESYRAGKIAEVAVDEAVTA